MDGLDSLMIRVYVWEDGALDNSPTSPASLAPRAVLPRLFPNCILPSSNPLSPPLHSRYLQSLNASLVYFDRPDAQYCPCNSWTGNEAFNGAVGEVASSSPMIFYLEYASPVPEGGGGHPSAAGEGHVARRVASEAGGAVTTTTVASVAGSGAAGSAAQGEAMSSASGHGATVAISVSTTTTEAPATDGENPVRAALDGVPVLVPAYTSGSPLALGVLLYDMYR